MTDERLLTGLQELGFTKYESEAYVAAVQLGTAEPTDLVEESDVPQARIYDVIDDLQAEGLIEVHERSRGKEVTAPPPTTVLEEFKRRRMNAFADTVDATASALEEHHERERNVHGFVTMVRQDESALRHIRRAIRDAEWWLTLSLSLDRYREVADDVRSALDRGVTTRLVLRGDDAVDDVAFPAGLRVRSRPVADTITVADRTYGVFGSAYPAERSRPYVVTQEQTLVLLYQSYCEQIWAGSRPVQRGNGFPRRYIDPWRLVVDLRDELAAGTEFYATVTGTHTETSESGVWDGPIGAYEMNGPADDDFAAVLPVTASITVDTDGEELTVGGWKATVEDVAARGVEVEKR